MIDGLNVYVVRTEYDYNNYVPANYRAQYSYDDSKAYLPWLVVSPYKRDEGIMPNQVKFAFDPTPDFTNLQQYPGKVDVSDDGKYIICDFDTFNSLLIDINKEVYPNGEFANGECTITMFVGDTLETATQKIVFNVGEMSVSEAQELIALNFAQQGQKDVAKFLNTIATKVYGVTYNTPPIS